MTDDRKSFRALVGAQFFGAFNDNLFKQLMLFLAAGYLFKDRDVQGMASAVFALPFVIFSGLAGDLSERFGKRTIVFQMKVAEIGIMLLGVAAFATKSWPFLLTVLFLMGTQSAFFGPSKYGIIPELVPPKGLLRANGVISMTTFAAILLGQALAGPLLDGFGERLYLPAAACALFAVVGTLIAGRMRPTPPQNPQQPIGKTPLGHLIETVKVIRKQNGLMTFVLLYSLFWFNGSVLQQAIVSLGTPEYLDIGIGEKRLISYLLVTLSLAIITGSVATSRISKRLGLGRTLTLGTAIMVAGQVALLAVGTVVGRAEGALVLCHVLLAVIGFAGAMFVVPIQTYLQHAPKKGMKGRTVAVNNFMNFLFMFLAGVYYLVIRRPEVNLPPTAASAIPALVILILVLGLRNTVQKMAIASDGSSPD